MVTWPVAMSYTCPETLTFSGSEPDATRHHLEELTLAFIDEGLA